MAINSQTTTDPGIANDSSQGFAAGSTWRNVTTGSLWVCTDASVGAAVWVLAASASPQTTRGMEGEVAAAVYDTRLRRLLEELLVTLQAQTGLADQGAPGTEAWKVDGSGVTQPVAQQGPVAVASLPPVTGAVTALQVGTGGIVATIVPYGNDAAQAVYDVDTRRLLEELLLELKGMRLDQEAHFARTEQPLAGAWSAN